MKVFLKARVRFCFPFNFKCQKVAQALEPKPLTPLLPEGAALSVASPRWRKLGTFMVTSSCLELGDSHCLCKGVVYANNISVAAYCIF